MKISTLLRTLPILVASLPTPLTGQESTDKKEVPSAKKEYTPDKKSSPFISFDKQLSEAFKTTESDFLRDLQNEANFLIKESPDVNDGKATLEIKEIGKHKFYIVALEDHHSKEAIDLFISKIAPKLSGLPGEKILFLIEQNDAVETQIFNKYAQKYKTITKDPIISPFTSVISDIAKVSPLESAQSIILLDARQLLLRYPPEKQESVTVNLTNDVAFKFNIKTEDLAIALFTLAARDKGKFSKETYKRAIEVREKLVGVSNDLSHWTFKKAIADNPKVTHVVVLIGGAHSPIFDPGYKPTLKAEALEDYKKRRSEYIRELLEKILKEQNKKTKDK